MKTNEEILLIQHLIEQLIKVSSPEDLKPFSYAFIKNRLRFKPVFETRDEFVKDILKTLPEDLEEQEKSKIISEDENFKKFLKEDSGVELYTIKLGSLEGKEFNLLAVDALIGTIIEE